MKKRFQIADDLQELTNHRTVQLPVACYKTAICDHMEGYIPLHWHAEFQLLAVVRGVARFFIQEETVIVQTGDGLYINSGALHAAYDVDGEAQYVCVNVSPHFVAPRELYMNYVYPYAESANMPFVYLSAGKAWAQKMLQSILAVYELTEQQPAFYELVISEHLQQSWRLLIENGLVIAPNTKEALRHAYEGHAAVDSCALRGENDAR